MSKKVAYISGLDSYLPAKRLTNKELETMVDTNDEWILSRTGIRERPIARPDETPSQMAVDAAKRAMNTAGCQLADIDCIICATTTPDHIMPNTACLIQQQLGGSTCPAFDVVCACSGFLYGLAIAKSFIESGLYRKVLVCASEKLSSICDYTDRSTCILFSDGAAAAVVADEPGHTGLRISHVHLGADGSQKEVLWLPAGGSARPASLETVAGKKHFIHMQGPELFKHAVRRMEEASIATLSACGLAESDISWLVPHQANMRIIESLSKRFSVPKERVHITVDRYANNSAPSVAIALHDLLQTQEIKPNEHILMPVFGGGLTWAACLLTRV